eukprot:4944919-Pyramimonas_sp.AAC.1
MNSNIERIEQSMTQEAHDFRGALQQHDQNLAQVQKRLVAVEHGSKKAIATAVSAGVDENLVAINTQLQALQAGPASQSGVQ